jgi:hypothetical protein
MSSPWASFTQDPRRPEAASLRASDRDRDVVLNVLGEAYADGRLRKDEHDERAAAATSARFLGELATPLLDLVPASPVRPRDGLALATPEELRSRAVRRWQAQRRDALTGLLIPLLCWGIWYFTSGHRRA